mgnify:CR=1 FL=1
MGYSIFKRMASRRIGIAAGLLMGAMIGTFAAAEAANDHEVTVINKLEDFSVDYNLRFSDGELWVDAWINWKTLLPGESGTHPVGPPGRKEYQLYVVGKDKNDEEWKCIENFKHRDITLTVRKAESGSSIICQLE